MSWSLASRFSALLLNVFQILALDPSAICGVLTPDSALHAFHNYVHTLILTLVTVVVSSTVLYIHYIVTVAHFTTLHLTVLMLGYEKLP